MPDDTVIDYKEIVRDTPKAWRFKFNDGFEAWLPKSQVERNRGRKTVRVPAWLMNKMAEEKANENIS